VKVPVLVALGEKSTSVSQEDAARVTQAVGGPSEVVVAPNATATLQVPKPNPTLGPVAAGGDMSMMGGGPIIGDAPRDQATMARITSFVGSSVGAKPA
jgi:hypothetical protein